MAARGPAAPNVGDLAAHDLPAHDGTLTRPEVVAVVQLHRRLRVRLAALAA